MYAFLWIALGPSGSAPPLNGEWFLLLVPNNGFLCTCTSGFHCSMPILQLTLCFALYQVGVCVIFAFFPSQPSPGDYYRIYSKLFISTYLLLFYFCTEILFLAWLVPGFYAVVEGLVVELQAANACHVGSLTCTSWRYRLQDECWVFFLST